MQRVASKAPATFATHIKDTQKRLNILFDHLNNEELIQPSTIEQLSQLANALQSKDYPTAQKIQVDIQRDKTEECGNWMVSNPYQMKLVRVDFANKPSAQVGVKRLITMSKATN
jgi:protein transport protein SEC31